MPRRDQTGPEGMGPMTGRGLGRCAGRGSSQKRSGFFGRNRRVLDSTDEERKKILEKEVESKREELEELNRELSDIDK